MSAIRTVKKPPPVPRSVEEILLAARESVAKSKRQFALSLGVTPSEYGRYESGKRNPPAKVINQALEVLAEQTGGPAPAPTARDLAVQIEQGLDGPKHIRTRQMLSELLGALPLSGPKLKRPEKTKTAAKRATR